MKKLASDKHSSLFSPHEKKKVLKYQHQEKTFSKRKKGSASSQNGYKGTGKKKRKKNLLNVNKRIKLDSLRRQERR